MGASQFFAIDYYSWMANEAILIERVRTYERCG